MSDMVIGWSQPTVFWFLRAWMMQLSGGTSTTHADHGVFIVDDHAGMRRVLRRLVDRTPGFYVTGEAASAEEALERMADASPYLALVDINLPGMDGIELVSALTARSRVKCVVVSAYAEAERVRAALAAGARAFVSKDEPHRISTVLAEVREDRESN